jgi:hypothetical protein
MHPASQASNPATLILVGLQLCIALLLTIANKQLGG